MKIPEFNHRSGKCPICKKRFRSDQCPHSIGDVQDRLERNEIRKIVRQELERFIKESE